MTNKPCPAPMVGYSGTPLARKLGIKPGSRLFVAGAPPDYARLVTPLPDDVKFVSRMTGDTDIAHLFATRRVDLAAIVRSTLAKLKPDGAIWISWPKKASRTPSDITKDMIREIALPLGLVDVKVCAVDEVWSGLKLVIRKKRR
ncbi:MAG TPA: hypothetical protein VIH25_03500 [Steroidobacteraceae bacterium]